MKCSERKVSQCILALRSDNDISRNRKYQPIWFKFIEMFGITSVVMVPLRRNLLDNLK